ncbi:polynucleotidyl transferase, partial [Striga asiatica]
MAEGANSRNLLLDKLQCPNKIKLFLWRMFHNTLPTALHLFQRHITSQAMCFRSSSHVEYRIHALRDCTRARKTWLELNPNLMNGNFFHQNSNSKQDHLNIPWRMVFLYAAWYLWYWRNCMLFDSSFLWPDNAAQVIRGKAKCQTEISGGWVPPEGNTVKVNVDASIQGQQGLATAGGLLRDSQAR